MNRIMKYKNYHEQKDAENIQRLREVLTTLPSFVSDFFRAKEMSMATTTRISYGYDIRIFFRFLVEKNPLFKNYKTTDFTYEDLDKISTVDIEEYKEYLKLYQREEEQGEIDITNGERGMKRKLSAVRSLFNYLYRYELIKNNPVVLVDMPKLHDKAIIRLEPDETARLLDFIEHGGDDLTGQKKVYYEKTKDRDLAIVTLLLGTGIRVSECVGLDVTDIDFNTNGIRVIRKGGSEMIVYFGDEVEKALKDYINGSRKLVNPQEGHENALFYSTQRRRIGVKAVENLVKKYSRQVTPLKKITPHKLRSTYGTTLYQETGDIYLVADVLGHKDVNTTRKHYAAQDESRRRSAANVVKLRKE
ncbi:tyrosine-type recombinase/integrase [Laedolimicola ammoniilytica]